ncbi:MAG: TatD family hydrolase [Kineosporiaceae bacterium]
MAFSRPPAPEPLPLPVVDNHAHLDHTRSGDEPFEVADALAAAAAVNVTRHVQIGCELDSARWTVDVVDRFPQLLGGVALHPTEASRLVTGGGGAAAGRRALDEAFDEIARLAEHPRVRVVGETGLDHYWVGTEDTAGRAAQVDSFARHVDLAKRLDKVLQVHDRDAHDDVLAVLRSEGAPRRTVLHCFSGDAAMARVCADNGWYLSFAGTVTFKNAGDLREALRAVPVEQVMVETDAPYLAPAPHRGRTNAGYLVPVTVRCMAQVLGVDLEALCVRLDATSEAVYGPW